MLAQRRKLKFFIDRVLRTCYIIVMISRTFLLFLRKWARLPVFPLHLLLITSTPHALVSFLPITIHFLFDLPIIRFQSIPHRSRPVHVCYSKTRFSSITLSNFVTSQIHFEFFVLAASVRLRSTLGHLPSVTVYSGLSHDIARNGTIRTNNGRGCKSRRGPTFDTKTRVLFSRTDSANRSTLFVETNNRDVGQFASTRWALDRIKHGSRRRGVEYAEIERVGPAYYVAVNLHFRRGGGRKTRVQINVFISRCPRLFRRF